MGTNGWRLVGAFALVAVVAVGVVSTSALTSVTMSRDASVSVTADDAAMFALVDGHPNTGLVEQTSGSTLAIDLTLGGATGANANATVVLGSTAGPISDHAFRMEHRGDYPSNLTASYSLSGSTGAGESTGPASLVFTLYHDAGDDGDVDAQASANENDGSTNATISGVAPGDPVYATVEINTSGLSATNDLTGTLELTAAAEGA